MLAHRMRDANERQWRHAVDCQMSTRKVITHTHILVACKTRKRGDAGPAHPCRTRIGEVLPSKTPPIPRTIVRKTRLQPHLHPACTFSHYPNPNADLPSQHHHPCYVLVVRRLVESSTCDGTAGENKSPARLHRWWRRFHDSTRGEAAVAARLRVWHCR